MSDAGDLLFVYGTLRPHAPRPSGEAQRVAQLLQDRATHVGTAVMRGKLYRVSWYPGARDSLSQQDLIHGDVFQTPPDLFTALDAFEGATLDQDVEADYLRRRRPVTFVDGRRVLAWTYLYHRPVDALARIDSGDFLLRSGAMRAAGL